MQIKKAVRQQAKLRIGLFGPSGSGKTTAALKIAYGLCGDWDKVLVIDTEHGSASLYADMGGFNVIDLEPPFTPERYIEAIRTAQQAQMQVIVIDSITHEWAGKGGVLEIHEQVCRGGGGNSYTAWAKVTPRHNAFVDAVLASPAHVICCSRTKDDVSLSKNDKGKDVPQKVGLKAVTRDGFDYEMTLCFDIAINHLANASKDRTRLFMNNPDIELGENVGRQLAAWADSGEPPQAQQAQTRPQAVKPSVTPECQALIDESSLFFAELGWDREQSVKWLKTNYRVSRRDELPQAQLEDMVLALRQILEGVDTDESAA